MSRQRGALFFYFFISTRKSIWPTFSGTAITPPSPIHPQTSRFQRGTQPLAKLIVSPPKVTRRYSVSITHRKPISRVLQFTRPTMARSNSSHPRLKLSDCVYLGSTDAKPRLKRRRVDLFSFHDSRIHRHHRPLPRHVASPRCLRRWTANPPESGESVDFDVRVHIPGHSALLTEREW